MTAAPDRTRITRLLCSDGTLSRLALNEIACRGETTDAHVYACLVQLGGTLERWEGVRDLLVSHGLVVRDGDVLRLTEQGKQAITPERVVKPYVLSSWGDVVGRYRTFDEAIAAVPEVRKTYGVYARNLDLCNVDQADMDFDGLTDEEHDRWSEAL